MKTSDFMFYLYCCNCELTKQSRLYWEWEGETGGRTRVSRKNEYLERSAIYLHCMDVGIDMPEKFAAFQATMDKAWPGRRFNG